MITSRRVWISVLLAAMLALTGCSISFTPAPSAPTGPAGSALAALRTLPVKERDPKTGYSREQFGSAWSDIDRDGCDQRNQVLARDMTGERFGDRCVVLSGTLHDPYAGKRISFVRGRGTSDDVQIDHVVSLSDAWQTGARQLDAETRKRLANDPLNLLAVDGRTNQQKSDADAAKWLPPNPAYRCAYVARQVAVKSRYQLWVTPPEREAMTRVLSTCPDEPLPSPDTPASATPSARARGR